MNNGVNDMNIIENSIEFSVTLRSEAVKRIGRLEESLFASYYRQVIIAKAVGLMFSGSIGILLMFFTLRNLGILRL